MSHNKTLKTLKERYSYLRQYPIKNPIAEQEWNELARLFVQRFQEIHEIPHDSLAGLQTFDMLEKTSELKVITRKDWQQHNQPDQSNEPELGSKADWYTYNNPRCTCGLNGQRFYRKGPVPCHKLECPGVGV